MKIVFADDPLYAGVIALYLFIAFFLLQVVVTPFKSAPGNETALYCSLCTCLTLVGALAMTAFGQGAAGTEKYYSIQVITVCAVLFGAYFIAKNAGVYIESIARSWRPCSQLTHRIPLHAFHFPLNSGMELYMNAKAELLAKLSASVMNIPVRHCLAPVCCDDALLHFLFQCLKRDVLSLLPPL